MGRPRTNLSQRSIGIAAVAACLVALIAVAPAMASRGSTVSATQSKPEGNVLSATASCGGKTHASGGGFQMTPGGTGTDPLSSWSQRSTLLGRKSWSATSSGNAGPAGTQTYNLKTSVRCETKVDGKVVIVLSGSLPLSQGIGGNLIGNCPTGTHALTGGYTVNNHTAPGASFSTTSKLVVLQSRRTLYTQWTFSAFILSNPSYPASTLTGTVFCELNSRRKVSVRSSTTPMTENGRTVGFALCPKGTHVVGGGFLFTPAVFPGAVPVPFMDRSSPASGRSWQVESYDIAPFGVPPGAALRTDAYCRKNKLKRRRARRGSTATVSGAGSMVADLPRPVTVLGG